MRRRETLGMLGGAAAWPLGARAQQGEQMRRIGMLMSLPEQDEGTKARLAGLQLGLRRLGWVEGSNIHIDYRFEGLGATWALPTQSAQALWPAWRGQAAISRAFCCSRRAITGKWLALLKDIATNLTRAAFVINPKSAPFYEFYLGQAQTAASSLGIELVFAPINDVRDDIERALDAFARVPNGGLLLLPDINTNIHIDLIIALAARHRLPAIYSTVFSLAREDSSAMARTEATSSARQQSMLIASCMAPSPPICQCKFRPGMRRSSTSRRRRRSA